MTRPRRGRPAATVLAASIVLLLALAAPVRAQAPGPTSQPAPARPADAAAQPVPCVDAPAVVSGGDARGRALACGGVNDARRFLAPLGLDEPVQVPIHAVEQLPMDLRADAAGCYLARTRAVFVLTLQRFLERGKWFGVPVTEALYRALVAHEVAHAIVGCHLGERTLPSAAHEYVAYVTMFATMDPGLRARVLAAMPADTMDHDAEINDLRYAFDPMRFGVEAYRHWRRQPDGMAFLDEVIRGRIAPELPNW